MLKKFLSLCLSIILLTAPIGVKAQAETEGITRSTVITRDNIYDVLEYVGLDDSAYIECETGCTEPVTVGELIDAINSFNASNNSSDPVDIYLP